MSTAAVIVAAASVLSAFSYRPDGGAGLFPYESAVAEKEPLVNIANPSSLPFQKGFFITTRAENPYGMEGLAAYSSAAGYSSGGTGVSAAWSRFGIKEYREDRGFLSAGKSFRALSLGARAHADMVRISMVGLSRMEREYDADFAVRLDPLPFFSLGAVQQNIATAFMKRRSDILFSETDFGVAVFPAKGISLSWNYNRTFYGGVNSAACSVYLLSCVMVGAGYSKETGRCAVQTALLFKGVRAGYAFTYHPVLGVTHSASVSWSPSYDGFSCVDSGSLAYHAVEAEPDIKADIATCTAEELASAAGIPVMMAERVIRSRELSGHVSEKTLYQMGLSPRERDAVMAHTEGIISEKQEKDEARAAKEREWQRKKNVRKEKTKDLFIRLVDEGLAPPKALKAAQIAKRKSGADFTAEIMRSNEFSADEKKRIISICAGQ